MVEDRTGRGLWTGQRVRRVVITVSTMLLVLVAVAVHAQTPPQRSFDIPAQALSTALTTFGQQSGLQVSVPADLLGGKTSTTVKGELSPAQALSQMLTGTGLTFHVSGTTVTLEPAPQASEGGIQLGPVRVEAETDSQPAAVAIARIGSGTAEDGYRAETPAAIGPWEGRSLQDTPYSVSITPAALIANVQATTADQVYRIGPTAQFSAPQSQNDTPGVYLRGFASGAPARDGLMGGIHALGTTTEDAERIEILTGLSGFLYGAGNVGGVINYISKRPTPDRYSALTVGYTGGANFYTHADFGGPIDASGRFGYRINAVAQGGDTIVDDGRLKKYFGSGAFDWRVTDRLLVQVDGSYRDYRARRQAYWALASGIQRPSADRLDPTLLWSQRWTFQDGKSTRMATNVRWDANEAVTLRAAYLDRRDERAWAFSINNMQANDTYNQISYRTPPQRLEGTSGHGFLDVKFHTGPFTHKLTAGYRNIRSTRFDHEDGEVDVDTLVGAALNGPPAYVPEPLWPLHGQLPQWNGSIAIQHNWMLGDDIAFGEQWSALIGANRTTIGSRTRPSPSAAWGWAYKDAATTPTMSLIYKPTRGVSIYGTYMEALEQGGEAREEFNGYLVTNAGEVLSPLISRQVETGVKVRAGQIQFTGALFQIDKGLQYYDISTPTEPTYVQDGRQAHRGLELTATGRPMRNLTLVGGFTQLDARVREQKQNPALEGKRPTGAAGRTFKLYGEYDVSRISGLTFTGSVNLVGSAWADNANTDKLPGYGVLDLGARYAMAASGSPVNIRLSINNVTNTRYWINSRYLGDARTVLISTDVRF